MGFEPTTLRDLVGCSNHWVTGDSMASKGEEWCKNVSCCCTSTKDSLGGCMVASLIYLNVTAWCSYESYVLVLVSLCDCDAVLVKYPYFTLVRHPFDAKTYHVLLLQKDSLLIFEQLFSYFTWFGRSFRRLNFDKFRDTAPLIELCKMALFLSLFAIYKILPPKLKLSMCVNDSLLSRAVAVQILFILWHEKLRSIRYQSVNITLSVPVQILFILWHEKLRSIRYQSVNIASSVVCNFGLMFKPFKMEWNKILFLSSTSTFLEMILKDKNLFSVDDLSTLIFTSTRSNRR